MQNRAWYLKPRLKQYMEFNWTYHDGGDRQIHLSRNNDWYRFFFYKDARVRGGDYYTITAYYSPPIQTDSKWITQLPVPYTVGLAIDYQNCTVGWYINGSLQYKYTLAQWSENRDSNSNMKLYTVISSPTDIIPTVNIQASEMKYPIPSGYVSVYEGSYPFYKIYDDGENYSYK